MDGLSTSDVLRAAAEQISLEDRLSSTDAMFRASEEIALERGLSSPVKQRPVLSPRSISRSDNAILSKTAPVEFQSIDSGIKFSANLTTNVVLDQQVESRAVDQGANDLLEQMGIPIKPALRSGKATEIDPATNNDEDIQSAADAAKLQNELDKKDAARAAARRAMLKSPSRSRYTPQTSKSVDGFPFNQSRASEYSKTTVQSSLSAVGAVLNKLGPRESASKEALFRAMKVN